MEGWYRETLERPHARRRIIDADREYAILKYMQQGFGDVEWKRDMCGIEQSVKVCDSCVYNPGLTVIKVEGSMM